MAVEDKPWDDLLLLIYRTQPQTGAQLKHIFERAGQELAEPKAIRRAVLDRVLAKLDDTTWPRDRHPEVNSMQQEIREELSRIAAAPQKLQVKGRKVTRITVVIDAVTNMDDHTLEKRLENFIDPVEMNAQLLGNERITFVATVLDIKKGTYSGD